MKNVLFYYYHLYPEKLLQRKKVYIFQIENKHYYFFPVFRSMQEIKEIILLTQELNKIAPYATIISNRQNEYITFIEQLPYVLLEYNKQDVVINIDDILLSQDYSLLGSRFPFLARNNWGNLWTNKIDYFEYQKVHIKNKYKLLYESMDYYIGYAEVAISYFEEIKRTFQQKERMVVPSHQRLKKSDTTDKFYNPFSLILDDRARDWAEFLKSFFFEGYKEEEIVEIISKLPQDTVSLHLLLARLLFPSFYFDLYEKIINDVIKEKEIYKVLEKNKDYEDFLFLCYKTINQRINLRKIDFLEKERNAFRRSP